MRGKYDERIIAAFLNNFKAVDIMRELHISDTKYYKLKKDPELQRILQERKDSILSAAINKMRGYLLEDVDKLQEIITDTETAAQTRVNAIQILMNQLRDWTTTTDIIQRLEALENDEKTGLKAV